MSSRRTFLAGAMALAAAPLAAQERRQVRIGMLETVSIAANNGNLAELHKGLQDLGYEEGKTYIVLYRSAEGHTERFPALAAELVRQKVDVFLTRGTPRGRRPRAAAAPAAPRGGRGRHARPPPPAHPPPARRPAPPPHAISRP